MKRSDGGQAALGCVPGPAASALQLRLTARCTAWRWHTPRAIRRCQSAERKAEVQSGSTLRIRGTPASWETRAPCRTTRPPARSARGRRPSRAPASSGPAGGNAHPGCWQGLPLRPPALCACPPSTHRAPPPVGLDEELLARVHVVLEHLRVLRDRLPRQRLVPVDLVRHVGDDGAELVRRPAQELRADAAHVADLLARETDALCDGRTRVSVITAMAPRASRFQAVANRTQKLHGRLGHLGIRLQHTPLHLVRNPARNRRQGSVARRRGQQRTGQMASSLHAPVDPVRVPLLLLRK